MLGAFCLTEPHVGSDASALRTTAVKEGNEYVLNGVKQFITSGKNGQVAIVIAVTDKAAGKKGMSAFIVPTSAPGYVVARLEDKLGQHSSDTAQINFDNCRIPGREPDWPGRRGLQNRPGRLWKAGALASPRKAWAWRARPLRRRCSTAKSARASASPSSTTRPWAFAWPNAPRRSRRRASSSGTRPACATLASPCLKEAAMAKLFASEMAERVCSAAIQTLGGYGVVNDFPVERIYRDVRVCQIYEGTSDVQKILIQRALA